VIVPGLNEEATIEVAIRSLLAQGWPELEIIVVDDHSSDRMYERAAKYARRGLVRLVRNNSSRGRLGKPAAINLGVRVSRGEFVLVVDADTTFDRRMIESILEPFSDPRVGAVAGNVHVRNRERNLTTRVQTIEYAIAIDLRKRWTDLWGCTLQASGAITAFRRAPLLELGGWMQELAEDTDISLRMVKAGWKLAFAPGAVAITDVPESLAGLSRQRARWDRGGLRNFFKKHHRLMRPSVAGWAFATEMWAEFLFSVVATLAYPVYCVWMAATTPWVLGLMLCASISINVLLSLAALGAIACLCTRIQDPGRLVGAALAAPWYKEVLRWVRFKATVFDLLRLDYEDRYLPQSAWAHAPRW
jgi:cellulose synthase/poly-beta-1,6-N-acetylglucosamine synthase-like glycosyltransferase